ncbi:hypothetical protein TrVE_jg10179 [Triparma verrucosa]|uniref:Uncharacterized protein n=1 Tax=Triparma verrucosa TaxID=1606542 RepID=A0A9W7BBG0_9STRA|nr:hypothetical protein TrVE_jg10179 [Triparma verrucosa]
MSSPPPPSSRDVPPSKSRPSRSHSRRKSHYSSSECSYSSDSSSSSSYEDRRGRHKSRKKHKHKKDKKDKKRERSRRRKYKSRRTRSDSELSSSPSSSPPPPQQGHHRHHDHDENTPPQSQSQSQSRSSPAAGHKSSKRSPSKLVLSARRVSHLHHLAPHTPPHLPPNPLDVASTTIQRVFRGHYFRKSVLPTLLLTIEENRYLSYSLMSSLIDSFITDVFIPDLLVEVLLSNGRDYDLSSSDSDSGPSTSRDPNRRTRKQIKRESHGIYAKIEPLGVTAALKIICGDVVAEILDQYLDAEAAKRENHPLLIIRTGLVDEVIAEEVKKLCADGVDEVVKDYLFMKECKKVYDGIEEGALEEVVTDVCESELYEESLRDICETLLEDVVASDVQESAKMVLPMVQAEEKGRMELYEFNLVNEACKNSLLMTGTIKSLANTAGHRGETLIMAELCNSILHNMMAKRFMQLLRGIEDSTGIVEEFDAFKDVATALCYKMGVEELMKLIEEEGRVKEQIIQMEELEKRNETR